MSWSRQDKKFMTRCLSLAKKGEGSVSPNPLVGCVVVKNGKIISEGFHEKFGGLHAEANALRGIGAKGATLYVTLEPCPHCGGCKKTPPCVPLLINAGVSRVVIAAEDPNPCVDGCGIAQLRSAGIRVDVGLLAKEAERQNGAFFKFMRTGKPFLLAKMAQSANGKIGIRGKGKVRISGKAFDSHCHQLRNRCDAILVGINTVLEDDPRLTCRMEGGRNPARIVLDSRLRIPLAARVLRNAKKERVLIFTSGKRCRAKEKALRKMGVQVMVCGRREVDAKKMASLLPSLGIYSLLIEGGAKTIGLFLKAGLLDGLVLAASPKKIDGGNAVASPITPGILRSLKGVRRERMGADTVIEGRFKP